MVPPCFAMDSCDSVEQRLGAFIDRRIDASMLREHNQRKLKDLKKLLGQTREKARSPRGSPSQSVAEQRLASRSSSSRPTSASPMSTRPPALKASQRGSPAFSMRPPSLKARRSPPGWQCPECSYMNIHAAVICLGCGFWQCPECGGLNNSHRRACRKCKVLHPDARPTRSAKGSRRKSRRHSPDKARESRPTPPPLTPWLPPGVSEDDSYHIPYHGLSRRLSKQGLLLSVIMADIARLQRS